MPLVIRREHLQEIVDQCRRQAPLEACGILSGKDGVVSRVYPMTNIERSPVRYLMQPEEQFKVMTEVWERGEDLVAIYHSHPASQAYPSRHDIAMAYYPEAVYVIISLAGGTDVTRAFHIRDGSVEPVDIVVRDKGEVVGGEEREAPGSARKGGSA